MIKAEDRHPLPQREGEEGLDRFPGQGFGFAL